MWGARLHCRHACRPTPATRSSRPPGFPTGRRRSFRRRRSRCGRPAPRLPARSRRAPPPPGRPSESRAGRSRAAPRGVRRPRRSSRAASRSPSTSGARRPPCWRATAPSWPRRRFAAAFAVGLALTGRLSFAPALASAGLALAARAYSTGVLTLSLAVRAAVVFGLGLSPYLYLVFADQHFTLTNYLHYAIEPAGGQFGLTPARFDTTPERLGFLFFGTESHPHDFPHHLPTALVNLGVAWARFVAFEVGPIAIPVALAGAGALRKRDPGAARLLVAVALATPVLGALVVDGALLNVFMMATTLAVAALAACGLDAWLA